jgi:hypothetical protein
MGCDAIHYIMLMSLHRQDSKVDAPPSLKCRERIESIVIRHAFVIAGWDVV